MPALNISHGVSAVCFAFSVQNESIFEPFCDNEQQSQEILHAMRKHWIVAFSQPTTEKKIRPELPDPLNCSFENRYNRKFPLETHIKFTWWQSIAMPANLQNWKSSRAKKSLVWDPLEYHEVPHLTKAPIFSYSK